MCDRTVKDPLPCRQTLVNAMRKQFKNKARSCALCKPHKRGWDHRWKPRERQAIREADRAMRDLSGLRL